MLTNSLIVIAMLAIVCWLVVPAVPVNVKGFAQAGFALVAFIFLVDAFTGFHLLRAAIRSG